MIQTKTLAPIAFGFGMFGLPFTALFYARGQYAIGTGVFLAGAVLMLISLTAYGVADSLEYEPKLLSE